MEVGLKKKIILDFIKKNKLCVISTISSENKPESAVMVISQKDNLQLIFQTPNNYRKYINLKHNPRIAVVFGFDLEEFTTVQYEGIAEEAYGKEIDECRKIHVAKNPKSTDYAYLPQNKYFIVSPMWIRYWNFNTNERFELTF